MDAERMAMELDMEIAFLKSHLNDLHQRRATYLANHTSQTLADQLEKFSLSDHSTLQPSSIGDAIIEDQDLLLDAFLPRTDAQARHIQECLYRLGAGATMFEVRNPDPNAVDGGKMFGVRIEVFVNGAFLPPHYILLHRPSWTLPSLRIHRHTLPPCIPVAAIAKKYLPVHENDTHFNIAKNREQNLAQFVRTIRRDLVSYHLRLASMASLRNALGIDSDTSGQFNRSTPPGNDIKNITLSSADALDFRLEWEDGKVGQAAMDKEGRLHKCIVMKDYARDRDMEKLMTGGDKHIVGLQERCLWLE
ncbi:MAG: hypothetical protein M1829_005547 [Trizodia sp. TS-e1964]|nr:MAG: hypothetical protein M1829_005547 [Trizodia sp. TS-e1964]